jgi:Bacteriocin-protection, YdeI or OmpD-Associated
MKEVVTSLENVLEQEFIFPADILAAIKADQQAWKNYQNFSDSYKRIRVAFIEGARHRPAEFQKRLNYFIKTTRENKIIGFGGIEKYY